MSDIAKMTAAARANLSAYEFGQSYLDVALFRNVLDTLESTHAVMMEDRDLDALMSMPLREPVYDRLLNDAGTAISAALDKAIGVAVHPDHQYHSLSGLTGCECGGDPTQPFIAPSLAHCYHSVWMGNYRSKDYCCMCGTDHPRV